LSATRKGRPAVHGGGGTRHFTSTIALALFILRLLLWPGPAHAQGIWLDAPLINWNPAGRPIPPAARGDWTPPNDPMCVRLNRPPETAEDRAVAAAGWTLWGPYERGWGVSFVRGLAGYDGMCRPMDYQVFVFVDGAYAGTIAPLPMASRSDGSGDARLDAGGEVSATFTRYAPTDALCCPSRPSVWVTYRIERTPFGPSLVPVERVKSGRP
jgi:hypothetical protein